MFKPILALMAVPAAIFAIVAFGEEPQPTLPTTQPVIRTQAAGTAKAMPKAIVNPALTATPSPIPAQPAPGVYTTEPYAMIVRIPEPMDAKMVAGPSQGKDAPIIGIQPPLQLIPKRP
jgi:hypothetical protein